MIFKPRKLNPGDELTTYWLNRVLAWCQYNTIRLGPNSGLSIQQSTLTGTQLRVSQDPNFGQLAVTVSSVSANVANSGSCTNSGTLLKWAPGTGSVYLVNFDGSNCYIADTSTDPVVVLNFSTTTGGIPADTLVWIQKDNQGNWVITAVDCGN